MRTCTSFNEKIINAFNVSAVIANHLASSTEAILSKTDLDLVYGHADGLISKHLYNMRDGICSLAASIAFNAETAENKLDIDIKNMHRILNNLNN